jgi:GT2 family glycosyltransferase
LLKRSCSQNASATTTPAVTSVIVVNWNGAKFLDRCLFALTTANTLPDDIVLVDNASTDDSMEIAKRYPTVRILQQSTNLGFAVANNLAANSVRPDTDWIILVNPDAFVSIDWLDSLLLASREYPQFDVFACKLLNATDPSLLDGIGDAYHISGLPWRVGHGDPSAVAPSSPVEIFSPCAAAAMYRCSAFRQVGGFDEDFFCYVEDVDLGFRLRLAGYKCLLVPASVVHHVGSGTTGGKRSAFATYYGHRNLVWAYVKNVPAPLFWLCLPLHLLMNLAMILWGALRGEGRVMLRSKMAAIKGIPKMWAKRATIQSLRIASIWQIFGQMTVSIFR